MISLGLLTNGMRPAGDIHTLSTLRASIIVAFPNQSAEVPDAVLEDDRLMAKAIAENGQFHGPDPSSSPIQLLTAGYTFSSMRTQWSRIPEALERKKR